jgi:hypothetical protein
MKAKIKHFETNIYDYSSFDIQKILLFAIIIQSKMC